MRRVYRGRKKIGGRGGGLAVHQKGSESESEEPPYCTPSPSLSNRLFRRLLALLLNLALPSLRGNPTPSTEGLDRPGDQEGWG